MCKTRDQIAILQWDEASVSASEAKAALAAMTANSECDRTTIAEYLDDVGQAVRLLAKVDPAHRCYGIDMLSGYLNEAEPVLLQLVSMLSSTDRQTVRLVLTGRKGRPRKADAHPDKARQNASADLTFVARILRNQSARPRNSVTLTRVLRILASLGVLFRETREGEPRLTFRRPKGPPRDHSQMTLLKKVTIEAALQARGTLPIDSIMWRLIARHQKEKYARAFLPKTPSEFKTIRKSMRAEGWPSAMALAGPTARKPRIKKASK